MKTIGTLFGVAFGAMAMVPLVMGAVIFAPIIPVLAVSCVLLEGDKKKP